MNVFIKSFLALLLVAGTPSMAEVFPPELRYLTTYTTRDCTGDAYTFYDSVPNLDKYSWSNVTKSLRATGWWAFFSDTNYFTKVADYAGFDSCVQDSSWEIKSLRYVGSPIGLNDVYFNLYEDVSYQGVEVRGNTNLESVGELDRDVSHVAITGPSPWTFYTGQEHTGASVCVYTEARTADDGTVLNFAQYSVTQLGLPDNSVRSVRQGCHNVTVAKPEHSLDSSQADDRGQIIRVEH